MQLKFLQIPQEERHLYFEQVGQRRNLSSVIIEKDFWVCWLLGMLFTSKFSEALVFKGGTSLSKVFGAIHRFSEDIDLSLSPVFLNLPEPLPSPFLSRNQANLWMKKAEKACAAAVKNRLLPELENVTFNTIGSPRESWFEFLIDPGTHSPVLLFNYPAIPSTQFPYLKRAVKLEFGSLTDQQPSGKHPIRPWVADEFPDSFQDWHCNVVSLELERTFWEKATILHVEYHRPPQKPMPDRFSRHYADTAALALHPKISEIITQDSLRNRVIAWKSQFFGSNWARYDLAVPKTFRLLPPKNRIVTLHRDYFAMREMYLSHPMDFETILRRLTELERQINEKSF